MISNYNYYGDHRVREAGRQWYESVDMDRLTAVYQGRTVKVLLATCETCGGTGKHVNPSIDAGGLTAEDFEREPGFREEYMSGMYDVSCYECEGNRLVPIPRDQSIIEEILEDEEFYHMQDAERRMGA